MPTSFTDPDGLTDDLDSPDHAGQHVLLNHAVNALEVTVAALGATYDPLGAAAAVVSDTAYDATSWNGVTSIAPSKNAVRDYLNTLGTAAFTAATAYDAAGAAAAAQAASQPLDSNLTAFAGLAIAADKLPYGTGSHTLGLADFTAAGRALVDDADASAQRTTLELGTLATQSGTFSGTSSGTNTGDTSAISQVLTGYTSGAGIVSATDTILQAIQKLNGNDATNANLTGDVTSVGNATTIATVNSNVGTFTNASVTVNAKGQVTAASSGTAAPSAANPTASVGLTAVNGSASTFLRSDGAPALDQTQAYTFSALGVTTVNVSSANALAVGPSGNNNPTFRVVTNVASAATGLSVTGNAAGSGVTLTALSSGTDESIVIVPKAAGIIEQRNSTTAQALKVYNTYTDASNYERGVIDWKTTSNVLVIGLQIAGTGTSRSIAITTTQCTLWLSKPFGGDMVWGGGNSSSAANPLAVFDSSGGHIELRSGGMFGWSSSATDASVSKDTAVKRNAAGVIEVNTGTAGTYGGLITGVHTINPPARTSGVAPYLQVITPADTAQTASTEAIGCQFGGTNANPPVTVTRQYATGALTQHRENLFTAPTLAGVGTMTVTTAATVAITGAPAQGSGVTITNPLSLWVQAGNTLLASVDANNPSLLCSNAASVFLSNAGGGGIEAKGNICTNALFALINGASKLVTYGKTGTNVVRFREATTTGNVPLSMDMSTACVGIGHSAPVAQLDVIQTVTSTIAISVKAAASRTAQLCQGQTSAAGSLGNFGTGCVGDVITSVSTTSTDGTFDALRTDTLVANALIVNGDKVYFDYTLTVVSSATATRDFKLAFAGVTIFDSTALTFAATGTVRIFGYVIRKTSTTCRAQVSFRPSGSSTILGFASENYVTDGTLTGLTLTGTNNLVLSAAAAGTGAASADVALTMATIHIDSFGS